MFEGSLGAARQGVYNLDIKLSNMMGKQAANPGVAVDWKMVDWDITIIGVGQEPRGGYKGTLACMPPEMVNQRDNPQSDEYWTAEKAVVWNIGMAFLFLEGRDSYHGTVTEEMRGFVDEVY
ncbi:hypothetical protein N7510_011514 [Penicillium lagena]|uniref:uncharacterized protein n=1 Tax=Penicillium lagena TaxID=94218 RepID=UPI0025411DA8|nr:uncharacterized protein N7510_011514 [Penicillium lagena]KAJ5601980.1 hypothetical protein N7510_011514 [Penicillium lagena]